MSRTPSEFDREDMMHVIKLKWADVSVRRFSHNRSE
jgi:hypothetical protein